MAARGGAVPPQAKGQRRALPRRRRSRRRSRFRSHPSRGFVKLKTTGRNQDGQAVIEVKRTIMVYKRGYVQERQRRTSTWPAST
jgi:acyl dehydratase